MLLNLIAKSSKARSRGATKTAAPVESSEFLVRSRQEVIRLLNGMVERRADVSISLLNADHVATSTLDYVDETGNTLLLEYPRDWQTSPDAINGSSIMLECLHEDSRIQFQGGNCMTIELDGKPLVVLDIPQFMWRFHRRRDSRYKVPGLKITLNLGILESEAEVADLSVGGVGVVNCEREVKLDAGEVLRDCHIALPGAGSIAVDLTVQHQAAVQISDGRSVSRVGCQFTGLTDSARQLIAHYLDTLEQV